MVRYFCDLQYDSMLPAKSSNLSLKSSTILCVRVNCLSRASEHSTSEVSSSRLSCHQTYFSLAFFLLPFGQLASMFLLRSLSDPHLSEPSTPSIF